MNPILQALQRNQQPTQAKNGGVPVLQLLADIRSGKINPRQEVMKMIAGNPALKEQVNSPQFVEFARQFGATEADINSFQAGFPG